MVLTQKFAILCHHKTTSLNLELDSKFQYGVMIAFHSSKTRKNGNVKFGHIAWFGYQTTDFLTSTIYNII